MKRTWMPLPCNYRRVVFSSARIGAARGTSGNGSGVGGRANGGAKSDRQTNDGGSCCAGYEGEEEAVRLTTSRRRPRSQGRLRRALFS